MEYETEFGKLFLNDKNYNLLNYNSEILDNDYLFILGKILFWSFIHGGAWPTWFHPFQINFIVENNIDTIKIFKELQPHLYELAKKINTDNSAYNEIRNWWSNYRDIGIVSIINFI